MTYYLTRNTPRIFQAKRFALAGAVIAALVILVPGCDRGKAGNELPTSRTARQSRKVMGTFASLTAVAKDKATAMASVEAGYDRLDAIERLMSTYLEDSEVSRINKLEPGESMAVSVDTFACLLAARDVAKASGGAFDATCRPFVLCWRDATKDGRLPTDAELTEARQRVGSEHILLENKGITYSPGVAGLQVDLGGIAKGYALDMAAAAMREAGATDVLVDVGGDVVAVGKSEAGRPWRVGVRHPFVEGLIEKIELSGKAVATSGLQQRFFEIDGQRYSHIIDPRAGRPAAEAPCVTVIADDGMTADAWATAFSVLSVAEGQRLITEGKAPAMEVMWITGNAESPQITRTPGFAKYVVE